MLLSDFEMTPEDALMEKLIQVNNGKRYGQVIFLAGGAGSGKGFVIKNFLEGDKFKVVDVDEYKRLMLKIAELKNKHEEIKGLDLRNPDDVFKLHTFIEKKGIRVKSIDLLVGGNKAKDRLPNIIFDVTMKNTKDFQKTVPQLLEAGYDPKNIHLVWVLTKYTVAVKANRDRKRVVPDDILLQTHEGSSNTMFGFIKGDLPKDIGGGVYVVLNNRENTVFFTDDNGKKLKTDSKNPKPIIKDFTYVTLKKPGKQFLPDKTLQKQIFGWMKANIPMTDITKNIFNEET